MVQHNVVRPGRANDRQRGFFSTLLRDCLGTKRRKKAGCASILVRIPRPENVTIHEHELCLIDLAGQCTISCTEGAAWVTCPGRFCDYILHAGESLSLKGEGEAIVSGGTGRLLVQVDRD